MTATLARTARNFRTKSFTYNTLYCSKNWQIYNMGYCVTCYNRQQSSASLNLQSLDSITIKKQKDGWPDSCSLLPQQSKQGHRRWALQRGGWRRHCKKVNFHDWKADKISSTVYIAKCNKIKVKILNFSFYQRHIKSIWTDSYFLTNKLRFTLELADRPRTQSRWMHSRPPRNLKNISPKNVMST